MTSADVKTLQAPFRSGVAIEDYQLEPVARAVDAPRVNLLLADDVGLGKTIEAGLVAQELLLRHRARRVMVVCPAGLRRSGGTRWPRSSASTSRSSTRSGALRSAATTAARPTRSGLPADHRQPALAAEPEGAAAARRGASRRRAVVAATFDLLILDEAHHVAPAAPQQVYAVDSQQTKLIRSLAPHFTHRLFLSATPHNGYQASFTALLEILDDQRFARGVTPDRPRSATPWCAG